MATEFWKPMLAAKPDPEELDQVLAELPLPALYSPKLDGIRCLVQKGRLYSRKLKLIPNAEMQALWGCAKLNGLDGEIVVGPPTAANCFSRSTSTVMSRGKPAAEAVFYVFDKFVPDLPFDARFIIAASTVKAHGGMSCRLLPHKLISTRKALLAYEEATTGAGHEGVMRRSIDGRYKQGRSTMREQGLVAVKRFVDAEAIIVDTYEQERNDNVATKGELGQTKRSSHKAGKVGKGTLGGFTVVLRDTYMLQAGMWSFRTIADNAIKKKLSFNIGTGVGLTDAARAELWASRESLPGRLVKFRYQKVGTKDAPRIPIFLGFRSPADL